MTRPRHWLVATAAAMWWRVWPWQGYGHCLPRLATAAHHHRHHNNTRTAVCRERQISTTVGNFYFCVHGPAVALIVPPLTHFPWHFNQNADYMIGTCKKPLPYSSTAIFL